MLEKGIISANRSHPKATANINHQKKALKKAPAPRKRYQLVDKNNRIKNHHVIEALELSNICRTGQPYPHHIQSPNRFGQKFGLQTTVYRL